MTTHSAGRDLPRVSSDATITYLNAAQVRTRYGGMSDMALWRWLRDDELGFPKPLVINGRRFWKASELTAWEATMAPDRPLPSVERDGAPEPEAA
jgi:predicted DNA-binding transcriptional regulator AlpA